MAQKKAHEVDGWLIRPQTAFPIVLVYGPDRGLVSERANQFALQSGFKANDPFSTVRLDASELEADPGRLFDEAHTVAMFADRRLIWVRGAGAQKALGTALKDLCAQPPETTVILIEGGDLKKGSPIRAAVESGSAGMALPCYADQARTIESIIDDVLGRDGLAISPEARQALKASLGGDRLATRGEIEKLSLYARDLGRIELAHVTEIVGDVSAKSLDDATDAILVGDVAAFDGAYAGWIKAGNAPFQLLSAVMRQFQQLELLRSAVDNGASASAAVASSRPPVFFSRRNTVENAVRRWNARALSRALDRLQATVLASRTRASLDMPTIRQALLAITIEASRLR
ncbi:DNA polymerase III subunit delta [Aliihoeflea aestuarii]|uniref:DNA polymerase III subunit delta n=1 Tax=Aliihoeflea aestuarii TaxID=453840 RepID=UPI002092B21F|nr:DNA polymerase III subunit delta [Aliihoeflea aestuarii]MCO6391031.1 DNA polymerase III subunit delta [Aliihoeflea aestuarii]